jgi:hypothetical protein
LLGDSITQPSVNRRIVQGHVVAIEQQFLAFRRSNRSLEGLANAG